MVADSSGFPKNLENLNLVNAKNDRYTVAEKDTV